MCSRCCSAIQHNLCKFGACCVHAFTSTCSAIKHGLCKFGACCVYVCTSTCSASKDALVKIGTFIWNVLYCIAVQFCGWVTVCSIFAALIFLVWFFWRELVFSATGYEYQIQSCEEGYMLMNNMCIPNTTQVMQAQYPAEHIG